MVNCQTKCSYRSLLGQRKMLGMAVWQNRGRRKTERQSQSVLLGTSNTLPLYELRWRNCPDKIPYWTYYNLRSSGLVLFAVTTNYLFSKHRLRAIVFKIPAFYRPLLNLQQNTVHLATLGEDRNKDLSKTKCFAMFFITNERSVKTSDYDKYFLRRTSQFGPEQEKK